MDLCDLGTFEKVILRVIFTQEILNWIYLKYQ